MSDVLQILTAFGAGLLSFFSPCILPLLPAYICFITGLSVEELSVHKEKGFGKAMTVLPESLLFILGFSTVFVILGASATFLGSFLFAKQKIIKVIGGLIVIFFGLHISGLFNIKFLQYEKKLHLSTKPVNKFGSFLIGMVFGFGWTPCVGPILGSILMLAATKNSLVKGVLLLSFYSLGLGLPFFLLSIGVKYMLGLFSKIKKYFKLISVISGILLIVIGIGIMISSF
ncbi:MAG: cytochrome c biogenesis protein CcdA [Candidatus Auribacterota bacterium]|nr:cytochrome c biogenesis protein CcdA [Candidatus Auribacterota bacterium]